MKTFLIVMMIYFLLSVLLGWCAVITGNWRTPRIFGAYVFDRLLDTVVLIWIIILLNK